MARYQVFIKRTVSPDGKIIAETKSVVATSDNNQSQISQSVSVKVSSSTCSTCISSISSSQSGSIHISHSK
jgi:hypothetical protein